jgi:molybdopterin-synthase adenylyltransferase
MLSDSEILRYNRQIVLSGFDFDGQEKLKTATVLIVGLGGLGCAASQYLAAAGIGKLILLDFDHVSLSNLQRQVLHCDQRIGEPKVESARLALSVINPHIQLETHHRRMEDDALHQLIASADLVLDATDNLAIREQLNRLCYPLKKPLVSGAAIRMEGQISVFTYQDDQPCYRCLSRLFADQTLSCVESGVINAVWPSSSWAGITV